MARGRRTVTQSVSLREQVYEIIREELMYGDIKPGERLIELELASRYGVSRTPVREALFQLAREGLIVSTDRGFCLPEDSVKDILDRIEVHMLIDPALARRATQEGTDKQIAELTDTFQAQKRAARTGDFRQFIESNHHFKQLLQKMCNNAPLARCSALIQDQFIVRRKELLADSENRDIALRYDERVLNAVRARDAETAARAAYDYMAFVYERFKPRGNEQLASRAAESGGTKKRRRVEATAPE